MFKLLSTFVKGDKRSATTKINIIFSFFLQGLSVFISFILVPLTINYLNPEEYGVWLTLNSIITWINILDVGLGNGLRNKLAEALAKNDFNDGQKYVSTTVGILFLIIIPFFLIFVFINQYLNWNGILNIYSIDKNILSKIVTVVIGLFSVQFVLKFINIVLLADQKTALNSLLNVLASFLSLIVIYILTKTTSTTSFSLLYVTTIFSLSPIIILLISYPFIFRNRYKSIRPKISKIDFSYSKELMGLGIKFFILQISSIIVFTTSNIIISQILGPSEVTTYNICFKYFSLITFTFNIILSPMWSAYTDAYVLNDIAWIKNSTKKIIMVWTGLVLVGAILMLISNFVYKIWIGDAVYVSLGLSFLMMIYVSISNWNNIFAQLLAGIGKIKLSLYNSVLNSIIFIPLSFYLTRMYGVKGIVLSMIVTLLTSSIWQPIQAYKILRGKAVGIWDQ